MIADPLLSVIQNVSGTLLEAATATSFDLVSNGPGSQTLRKAASPIAGISVFVSVKHELTKAGRRRSAFRVDAKAPIGVAAFGDASGVPHSASATLTIDRLESDTNEEKLVVDHALGALLVALVSTKAAGQSPFVPSTALLDFLNGEP